jgi:hypothetical protein
MFETFIDYEKWLRVGPQLPQYVAFLLHSLVFFSELQRSGLTRPTSINPLDAFKYSMVIFTIRQIAIEASIYLLPANRVATHFLRNLYPIRREIFGNSTRPRMNNLDGGAIAMDGSRFTINISLIRLRRC